jgi:flagellar FliL protein
MASTPKPPASDKGKTGESMLSILIAFGFVSICAGGIGFVSGAYSRNLAAVDHAKPVTLSLARTSAEDVQVVTLPSIVTNLGGSEGGWVRLELVVLLDGKSAVQSDLPARLAQDTTALLRTLSLRQISGASGFQHLREELMDRMKTRSADRVREIMIRSLVVE